ncbi:unnamed protein product [Adineta ricciae]|uniref:F-box domain-containing protein n=1 Tax=Adineta ricciae TaxID=249248 RepID=A0A813UNY8_ADIRI|nr:unnamed protein product [Adineta ricciae]CAF1352116.1 unnamed protein product [Adineta ricciae]
MIFESLPNELLLEFVEYFSLADLLRSFYRLNNRFTDLIHIYVRTHTINFQSISKSDFDFISQRYLSSIADHVHSLRFSDDDDTPQEVHLFFSHGLSLHQFSYLKFLSIHRFNSFDYLKTILEQLVKLPELNHLKITRYDVTYNAKYDIDMIKTIEHLPKVTSCYLDVFYDNENSYEVLSIISSSLSCLSFPKLNCDINQLIHLIKQLPNLSSLTISIVDQPTDLQISSIEFESMRKLNLIFYGYADNLMKFLPAMPNLEEFKVDFHPFFIDGCQWEKLIENRLKKLVRFQFKTAFMVSREKSKHEEIDRALNSFRSEFWIDKYQWFVQCHWIPNDFSRTMLIYTLPYAFESFFFSGNVRMKSTAPPEYVHHRTFHSIENLYYGRNLYENLPLPDFRLENIRHLDITIPYDQSFDSLVSSLDRLDSLKVDPYDCMNMDKVHANLHILCQRSSQLRSLKLSTWFNQHDFLFKIVHPKIRQLYLLGSNIVYNADKCDKLASSSIGQQCEVLCIRVEHRTDIVKLVNNMSKLRALVVKCIDTSSLENGDGNLVEWLREHLPDVCSISRTSEAHKDIRLWIR